MRHYKQMKQALAKALDDARQALRQQIETKLYSQDEQVATYAAENSVQYESNVRAAITRDTISSNIAVLQAKVVSNDWFATEIAKINAEVARRNTPPTPQPGDDTPQPTPQPQTRVVKVRLTTPSLNNIKTTADIEKYLDRLRKELTNKLATLNSGDEIQVL